MQCSPSLPHLLGYSQCREATQLGVENRHRQISDRAPDPQLLRVSINLLRLQRALATRRKVQKSER